MDPRLCVVAVDYRVLPTGEDRRRFVAVYADSPTDAVKRAEREVEFGWMSMDDDAPAELRRQVKDCHGYLHASYPLDVPADNWSS